MVALGKVLTHTLSTVQRTWEAEGIVKVSQLFLENVTALPALIHWNHLNGIRFFRFISYLASRKGLVIFAHRTQKHAEV